MRPQLLSDTVDADRLGANFGAYLRALTKPGLEKGYRWWGEQAGLGMLDVLRPENWITIGDEPD